MKRCFLADDALDISSGFAAAKATMRRSMKFVKTLILCAGAGLISANPVSAAEPIKIGVIVPSSGIYAEHGQQMQNGIKLFMHQHGAQVAGREIVLIYKDETGPAPDVAKRLVQELIVKEHVSFLAGFDFTPNASAVAPLVTQGKIPTIVMNASSAALTSRSPFIVRTSFTQTQVAVPLAKWAAANNVKKVYTLIADFSPGLEAEQAFKTAFAAAGGNIVGESHIPLANPDFAPFVQRVKDTKPDAVFVFEPAPAGIAFMKTFVERQLGASGIKVLSTGDLVEENSLASLGDASVGVISSHHYSSWHDSALNKSFVADYQKLFGKDKRPNFYAVGAYDGMRIIYDTIAKLGGQVDGDKAIAAIKGMQFESPRGWLKIDPLTRDIIQTVYIRKTEKADNATRNTEFQHYANVNESGK